MKRRSICFVIEGEKILQHPGFNRRKLDTNFLTRTKLADTR